MKKITLVTLFLLTLSSACFVKAAYGDKESAVFEELRIDEAVNNNPVFEEETAILT
jgi:hypothetical protein